MAKHLGLEYKADIGRVPVAEWSGKKLSFDDYIKELSFDEYIREYIKWCYGVN